MSAEKGADVACRVARRLGMPLRLAGPRYDDEYFAPTWAAADHVTQAGPIDALLANDSWQTPQVSAKDPALGAATVLRDMLKDRGVKVGDVATGVASPEVPQRQPVPLVSGACPEVRQGGALALDWNPGFNPPWGVTGMRSFRLVFTSSRKEESHRPKRYPPDFPHRPRITRPGSPAGTKRPEPE